MNNTSKSFEHLKDPTRELLQAIQSLDKFSSQNENAHSLQKTIALVKCFIKTAFSDKTKLKHNKERIQDEVLRAVNILYRHRLLIEKFKQGDSTQQKLAASAMAAIQRYNAVIEKAKDHPKSLSKHIALFLLEQGGWSVGKELARIDLPQRAFLQINSHQKGKTTEVSQKIASLYPNTFACKNQETALDQTTKELFYMKAISLMGKYDIASHAEARSLVYKTPIEVQFDPQSSKAQLLQCLSPFPGQTVKIIGHFQWDSQSKTYRPITNHQPDSKESNAFEWSIQSHQTGFPHPSQHIFWALSDCLIPGCLHFQEQLPVFTPLHNRKKERALALVSNGAILKKAKQLISLKRQVFEKNPGEWLEKHYELHESILKPAPAHIAPENIKEKLENFYAILENSAQAFEKLTETYQRMLHYFIVLPHDKLQMEWIERHSDDLISGDPVRSYQAALKLLEEQAAQSLQELQNQRANKDEERIALDFMIGMGSVLRIPAQSIILQHFSEVIEFAPPMLNDFEQRIQAAVYKQLIDFEDDLETELSASQEDNFRLIEEKMQCQMESSIALFQVESFESVEALYPPVNELEDYFNSRWIIEGRRQKTEVPSPSSTPPLGTGCA